MSTANIRRITWAVAAIWTIGGFEAANAQTFSGQVITPPDYQGLVRPFVADLDQDGDLDIVSAAVGSEDLEWYEQVSEGVFVRRLIASFAVPTSVFVADVTGDGHLDILCTNAGTGRLMLSTNNGGSPPTFSTSMFGSSVMTNPQRVFAADVDNDFDVDAVCISLNGTQSVRWMQNFGGSPPSVGTLLFLSDGVDPTDLHVADMDNDGKQDFVVLYADGVRVFRNIGNPPGAAFSDALVLQTPMGSGSNSLFVADLNSDGWADIITASTVDGRVRWLRNSGISPPAFTSHDLVVGGTPAAVFAADMDADGDRDVLVSSFSNSQVRLLRSGGGPTPQFSIVNLLTVVSSRHLFAADIDLDGDPDFLNTTNTGMFLFRSDLLSGTLALPEFPIRNNTSGVVYSAPHQLSQALGDAASGDVLEAIGMAYMFPGPLDLGSGFQGRQLSLTGLGDIRPGVTTAINVERDVFASIGATLVGPPQNLQMGPTQVPIGRTIQAVQQGRMRIDGPITVGDDSLLSAAANLHVSDTGALTVRSGAHATIAAPIGARVVGPFSLNTNAFLDVGAGSFSLAATPSFTAHTVFAGAPAASSVGTADLDGDGDLDVLSTSQADGTVRWHENGGETPPAFTTRLISGLAPGARSVAAGDLNGDGRLDVLAIAEFADSIQWFQNVESEPPAWAPGTVFFSAGSQPTAAVLADINGDGLMDVVSCTAQDDTIRWHENDGAMNPTFTVRTVSTGPDYPLSVFAADVNGDGHVDIVSGSDFDGGVRLHRNLGNGASFSSQLIATEGPGPRSVAAADLDGDGDTDIISASTFEGAVRWYEQTGASFTPRLLPASPQAQVAVLPTDVDRDGHMDIVLGHTFDGAIVWFRNDGSRPPEFEQRTVHTGVAGPTGVAAADLDADGDQDILSSSQSDSSIRWYEAQLDLSSAFPVGSTLAAAGRVTLGRPVSMNGGSIVAGGGLINNSILTGFGNLDGDSTNNAHHTILASTQSLRDYVNNGLTTIQNGTLSVFGTLTNNGVIVGDLGRSVGGGLFARNGYAAAPGATLAFPWGGTVTVGGAFDVAINDHARFHMLNATLRLNALPEQAPQSLEVMSLDIGPDPSGLDRTLDGHFPLGVLRVGPTATIVQLIDSHDNARDGQGECEAVYVRELIIEPGAALNTGSCRVYYETATLHGSVDNPANLVQLIPPCAADYDDNQAVEVPDIFAFLTDWFAGVPAAFEFGGTPGVPAIFAFLTAWFEGC